MGFKFNPFTGNFDQKGSGGGGGSAFFAGEVATYADLPLDGTAALNSRWLVRSNSGTWPFSSYKQAGIYIRTATGGTDRGADYTLTDTSFHDVMSDDAFLIFDNTDPTKAAKFDASAIATGTTRTISVPDKNITLDDAGDSRTPSSHAASHASSGSDPLFDQSLNSADNVTFNEVTTDNNLTVGGDLIVNNAVSIGDNGIDFTSAGATATIGYLGLGTAATADSTDFAAATHASTHAAGGSDPLALSDLGLGAADDVAFNTVAIDGGELKAGSGALTILDGNGPAKGSLQVSNLELFNESTGGGYALFDAQGNLTGARTYDLPDRSGELMLVGDAPTSHTHGNITNDGLVGTTSGLPLKTGTGGIVEAGAFGTSAGQFAEGNHTHTQLHDRSHAITSTSDHTAGNHKVFYSNGSGEIVELALGSSGTVLTSNGATSAPSFAAASGGDTVSIDASAADILSATSGAISADDAGSDKIVFWDDSASALKYLEVSTGLSISGTTLTATGGGGGSKTYAVFSAEHNQPPATNFATLDTRGTGIAVLDFDDATDESAVFVSIIPEGASLGSGLKIRLHWMATTATSGNVVWDVSLERMTTDLDSDSFDTIASGTAAANGTSGILTVTEITLTTIDSVTAGDGFRLKVTRDANNASDTMTGDAELVLAEVRSAA